MMQRILETTGAESHRTFLTGKGNFRYDVYSEYKANRIGKPQPIYRHDAEQYLIEYWGAEVTSGCEADDALGIAGCVGEVPTTICSIDKDLMMIPGTHFNWRRNEFYEVSPVEGLHSFYRSMLVGDSVDNIVGVAGIGVKKSAKLINDLENEEDMFNVVRALYKDDTRLLMNGQLLWIWRKENDLWRFPPVAEITNTEEVPPV